MPDTKITALTAIGANPIIPATFPIPMVDLTDTSMAASGTTKKVTVNQILGAGGTATLASATITGDLTVDTSTLKVDSTNNRVGIGTASPAQPLHVRFDNAGTTTVALFENRLTDFSSSTAGQIAVGSRGYNYTVLRQNPDGGTAPSIGGSLDTVLANISALGAGYGKLILATQNTARLSVHETSGDVSIANGNLVLGTSGKGIDFSATTSGSGTMTSELLNDYEEGNWTGTIGGTTSNPTTPVTSTGRYTKIGRQVSIQIAFLAVDTTGASSRILVTGLPFAASSSPNGITGSVLIDAMATFTGSPGVYLTSSSTQIDLYSSVSNGAIASVTHNAGAAKSLWLNVTYSV